MSLVSPAPTNTHVNSWRSTNDVATSKTRLVQLVTVPLVTHECSASSARDFLIKAAQGRLKPSQKSCVHLKLVVVCLSDLSCSIRTTVSHNMRRTHSKPHRPVLATPRHRSPRLIQEDLRKMAGRSGHGDRKTGSFLPPSHLTNKKRKTSSSTHPTHPHPAHHSPHMAVSWRSGDRPVDHVRHTWWAGHKLQNRTHPHHHWTILQHHIQHHPNRSIHRPPARGGARSVHCGHVATCDPPISATAAESRRFCPPLKVPASASLGERREHVRGRHIKLDGMLD